MEQGEHGLTELAGRGDLSENDGQQSGEIHPAGETDGKVPATPRSKRARLGRSQRLQRAVVRVWSKPPWEKVPKQAPTRFVLRAWRKWAFEAARAKGGRRACGLCKRATLGAATIELRPPWGTRNLKTRSLCSGCWEEFSTLLDQVEYTRNNYHQPIDRVCRKVANRE